MSCSPDEVTLLLNEITKGKRSAWDRLLKMVYQELHAMAHQAMRKEKPGCTLQTTALVNEAYLRMANNPEESWENRAHFFHVAARAIRRILVDRARARNAVKRGEGQRPVPLDDVVFKCGASEDRLLEDMEALDHALNKLATQSSHQRKCTLVELRFFAGLTLEASARVLQVSMATVTRDWEFTRAWLYREIAGGPTEREGI